MSWSYAIFSSFGGAIDRRDVPDWQTPVVDVYYKAKYGNLPTTDPGGGDVVPTPGGPVRAWVWRSENGVDTVPVVFTESIAGATLESAPVAELLPDAPSSLPSTTTATVSAPMVTLSGPASAGATTTGNAGRLIAVGGAVVLVAWAAGWLD